MSKSEKEFKKRAKAVFQHANELAKEDLKTLLRVVKRIEKRKTR